MSNRAFLVARSTGDPSAPFEDPEILAASTEKVAVFWLALFDEKDRTTRVEGGAEEPTLIVERRLGLARARDRKKKLLARFPKRCAPFFEQFLALVDGAEGSHVQLVLSELVAASGDEEVSAELASSLEALETGKADDLAVLLDRPSLELDAGAKRVEARAGGAEIGADLRGYAWTRPVPWSQADEDAFDLAWVDDPSWDVLFVRCPGGRECKIGKRSFRPSASSEWAAIPRSLLKLWELRELDGFEVIDLEYGKKAPKLSYRHSRKGVLLRSVRYVESWRAEGRPEPWESAVFADPARLARSLEALEDVVRGAGGAPAIRAMVDARASKLRDAFASERVSSDMGEFPTPDDGLLEQVLDAIAKHFGLPLTPLGGRRRPRRS